MSRPEYIELNSNNYDAEDVSQLNEWGIWAHGRIERLEDALSQLRREVGHREINAGTATIANFIDMVLERDS